MDEKTITIGQLIDSKMQKFEDYINYLKSLCDQLKEENSNLQNQISETRSSLGMQVLPSVIKPFPEADGFIVPSPHTIAEINNSTQKNDDSNGSTSISQTTDVQRKDTFLYVMPDLQGEVIQLNVVPEEYYDGVCMRLYPSGDGITGELR